MKKYQMLSFCLLFCVVLAGCSKSRVETQTESVDQKAPQVDTDVLQSQPNTELREEVSALQSSGNLDGRVFQYLFESACLEQDVEASEAKLREKYQITAQQELEFVQKLESDPTYKSLQDQLLIKQRSC